VVEVQEQAQVHLQDKQDQVLQFLDHRHLAQLHLLVEVLVVEVDRVVRLVDQVVLAAVDLNGVQAGQVIHHQHLHHKEIMVALAPLRRYHMVVAAVALVHLVVLEHLDLVVVLAEMVVLDQHLL
jgi:hypothetical protein